MWCAPLLYLFNAPRHHNCSHVVICQSPILPSGAPNLRQPQVQQRFSRVFSSAYFATKTRTVALDLDEPGAWEAAALPSGFGRWPSEFGVLVGAVYPDTSVGCVIRGLSVVAYDDLALHATPPQLQAAALLTQLSAGCRAAASSLRPG